MKQILLAACMLAAIATKTYAVRPFITDDGVVTGRRVFQWEGWAYFDKYSSEQWNQFTFGITDRWEVALGGVWGYARPQPRQSEFSYATPLIETKILLNGYIPGKQPGIAIAIGTALPSGKGEFVPSGHNAYGFLAVTHVFDANENFTLHGNIGLNYLNTGYKDKYLSYWGLGAQVRTYRGLHLVGEVISGDPYAPGSGLGFQAGVRYFISDNCQMDAEIGRGLSGAEKMPFWFGCGIRFVTAAFDRKKR